MWVVTYLGRRDLDEWADSEESLPSMVGVRVACHERLVFRKLLGQDDYFRPTYRPSLVLQLAGLPCSRLPSVPWRYLRADYNWRVPI